MSLLLEALKKAELAKQAAKEGPPTPAEPPFTRDRLPDISQPMEIHSEDMRLAEPEPAPKRVERPVLELAPEEPPLREPPPRTGPATRAAAPETSYPLPGDASYSPSGESTERKQAQQLFEAKELDVNPRKPFYITLAGLGLFALGTVVYFWYQLQPRTFYNAPPPAQTAPPAAAAPAAPVAPAALPDPQASATLSTPAGTPPAGTVAPAKPAAPAAVPPPRPAAQPNAVFRRQDASSDSVSAAAAPQAGGARRESNITITPARVQSDPIVEGAFDAFNAGDLARARSEYRQVLRYNPDSRDALLGLAAVETQARRYDAAEGYYLRLLELDPRDAHAQAGLISLHGQSDPLAAESRLKSLIASQPGVSFLHFALGNQFAAQDRWAEAQQSYFQAYTKEPEHPDFAYNLAVSLDRIHQSKPALEYYRRALALGADRPVSFDKAQVSKRIAQLEP